MARVLSPAARWTAVVPAALGLVTLLVFWPAVWNGFVQWDDEILFTKNPHYRGLGVAQIAWMFSNVTMGHYVPATWLTHGLDYVLWGMDPAGYHFTNLVVHAANAALFYLVALRLLGAATAFPPPSRHLAAVVSALFFAIHPLRAESVAWVTERRDVLSGLFFFLTLLGYLRAREVTGAARVRRHAAALVCYLLAIFSKSMVMTLPALLVLLDVYPFRRLDARTWRTPGLWREKAPYAALAVLAALLGAYAQAANGFFTSFERSGWAARPTLMAFGLAFYVGKTALPLALSPLYELPTVIHPLGARFVGPVAGVLVATVVLVALRRRWPGGLAAAAAYAILLAPVVGLVHSGYQLAHDRYSYLPCLPWALLVGAGIGAIDHARRRGVLAVGIGHGARAVVALWLVALGALTWQQTQIWKDTGTLWQFALDAEPDCTVCLYNQGAMFQNEGLSELARARFERVMAVRPDRARTHANLGLVYTSLGDLPRAVAEYQAMLGRVPDDVEAHNNLGVVWTTLGRPRDAAFEFQWALRLEDNPVFRANLALALLDLGQADEALAQAERAVARKPDLVHARFALGLVQRYRGDLAAARQQHAILRALDPRVAGTLGSALISGW